MNNETLLLRQVNPAWIHAGVVSSQTFRPTPKDGHQLSVYDGDLIAPTAAWEHFTAVLGFRSAGVLAVTVAECAVQELPARPDPTPFPEHARIDFAGHGSGAIKRKAQQLKDRAMARGWLLKEEKTA